MTENFNTMTFIKSIPAMIRKVWPGLWLLIVIITLSLYFSNSPLSFLAFEDWVTMHLLIVIGLIALTVFFYNAFKRHTANFATLALWLLASAACMMAGFILRAAGL